MSFYHLTLVSGNTKTGPMPVSITSSDTCPSACPLINNGCFAKNSYLGLHWRRISEGRFATDLKEFVQKIAKLPRNSIWRHNAGGDLPGIGNDIDKPALNAIVQANKKARAKGFTYTHKPVGWNTLEEISNATAITDANLNGFTINLSSNNLAHADSLARLGAGPVVTIVDDKAPRHGKTPEGRHYSVCPAQERDDVNCLNCRICALPKRKLIVAFRAHGINKKKTLRVIQGNYN